MINSKKLLKDLQGRVKLLEHDLRARCEAEAVNAPLRARYDEAQKKDRTAITYPAWLEGELTQIAVAWVLACVFVRFLEDNELVEVPMLAGVGERLRRAQDEGEHYFSNHPTNTERDFLIEVFEQVGKLPAMKEFFDKNHNMLWQAGPSGDACRDLLLFWQKTDAETGQVKHDFSDPEWGTRFLGDLYQDLSEAVRKKYALLQTPDFVQEFILDRTLTPAIETFGFREVRMIDPTCGSGHFLLGGFTRLLKIWQNECPGENPRVLAQNALHGVYGVDLNPYAVAVARFRLLLVALQTSGVKKLKNAPDFKINLAVGDSLIHGARFDQEGQAHQLELQSTFDTEELFKDEYAHFFVTEDRDELHRILGQQYHAVVGNPPYITVKDKALNLLYRARYEACHRQYALSVPFMEYFFDLALSGSGDGRKPAGFTGQITSNSFMKREFGKKLIEQHIPRWDITHVIDTSGAYIPGHGTPTVILLGRNAKPTSSTVRTVMGIKGESATPDNPAKGKVWSAILDQADRPGSESEFVSTADTEREKFHKHPWSLQGGGADVVVSEIENSGEGILKRHIDSIGRTTCVGEDDAWLHNESSIRRFGKTAPARAFGVGEAFRDWAHVKLPVVYYPYEEDLSPISEGSDLPQVYLWPSRTTLRNRTVFGKTVDPWYAHLEFYVSKFKTPVSITFAFVATHNHFVLDRGGKVFNRTAPVIKLPADATENDHLQFLGLLNSSAACFWMKQVLQGKHKGDGGDAHSTPEYQRFEFDGTKLKQFPVPAGSPLHLAREIDCLAQELSEHSPDTLVAREAVGAAALAEAEQIAVDLRARMISLQEELDWQCYRHYGLIEASDNLEWPEDRLDDLPPLTLGERAFEIRMARQMAAGELETTWFERHKDAGSNPITDLPAHWPDDYRSLVERRLTFIEANKNINLIERPEYKRRWNTEPWEKRQTEALRKWLLTRLEGYFFEGKRVCDLSDGFDPGSHRFPAANESRLVTVNQLADVVQHDAKWMEAAAVYHGASGFKVSTLLQKLIGTEVVPFLPGLRYKESGLRKRKDWEQTWEDQRAETPCRRNQGARSESRQK